MKATDTRPYGIADVVSQLGTTPRLLRFYEEKGLVSPQRVKAQRYYDDGDVERLRYVLKLASFGFTLVEIHRILTHRGKPLLTDLKQRREELAVEIETMRTSLALLDDEIAASSKGVGSSTA